MQNRIAWVRLGPSAVTRGRSYFAQSEAADSVFLRASANLIVPLSVVSLTAADQTIFRVGLIDQMTSR
jgi:hypothetical protein